MAQAKHNFRAGYLIRYRIERAPMQTKGWFLFLGDNLSLGVLVDTSKKEPRLFKTLDGAVAALEAIGFEIEILF